MGRNEIRLRRERMTAGRIARYRNYGEIMRIHERDMRLRRVFRAFTYFLAILFLIILLLIIWRWEKRQQQKPEMKHPPTTVQPTPVPAKK
jgi:predicted membrane protein